MSDRSILRVGLLWHSCLNENLGVGALSVANANLIAAAVEKAGYRPVFHIIGASGSFDYSSEIAYENDFTNVGYKALLNPFSSLHRQFSSCDIIFDINGGDSFSDIYSARRFGLVIASKIAAQRAKGPLIFSPQTIGPFFSTFARHAAVGVMNMASQIFARDDKSFALLQELGMAQRSSLTTDVAFALPFDPSSGKDRRDLNRGPIKVGINVSALMYRRDIAAGDKISLSVDYPALINELLTRLTANPRVELHLVPHVLAEATPFEDDYAVSLEIAKRFPDAILPERFTGPSAAKTYIAGLDLFAGSRMHATIAALSSGTAVVPLGYSRKFSGLFGSLGYHWNADLTSESNESVLARFEQALADVPAIRSEAQAANTEAQARLEVYKAFLDEQIGQIAERSNA